MRSRLKLAKSKKNVLQVKIRTKKNKKRIGLIEMQICLSAIKVKSVSVA